MIQSSFGKPFIVLFFVTVGYQYAASQNRDYIKLPYPDSLKSLGLKIEVWSILANHAMAGIEIPLNKNAFFEFNLGVSRLVSNDEYYAYEDAMKAHTGFMLRTGFKLPFIYTTALSMVYLMPEYAYTGYKMTGTIYDYNTGNQVPKAYGIRMSALLLNFGYRHVNPHSGFFYDIGIGYGVGFTNNLGYGYNAYSFDIANAGYYEGNPEQRGSGAASSFRGSIGWVLKKKNK